MKTLSPDQRHNLTSLFQHHKRQRVIIDAILQQPYGQALADSQANPQLARLHLGIFTLFAGNPNHPKAEMLIRTSHRGLLIAETEEWKKRILSIHTPNISTYTRYGFSLKSLNLKHLQTLAQNIPKGYHIHRVEQSLCPQIINETAYKTTDTFLENGVGFCALQNDQLASTAIAYTNSNHGIELQIYTEKAHQQKGLATATCATLIAHCLQNKIDPHWSAANKTSAHLAQKLGYTQNDTYTAIVYRKP